MVLKIKKLYANLQNFIEKTNKRFAFLIIVTYLCLKHNALYMEKIELTPLEWYVKVNEALTLALRDIRNDTYPQESHLAVMESIFPVYYNGELSLTKDINVTEKQILEQGTLFSPDNPTDSSKGTDIDNKG